MTSREDVLDLIRHLKQERLFVNAEKEHLQKLNELVVKIAERLSHTAWVGRQQRHSVETFVGGAQEQPHSCQDLNRIESVNFVDAYKHMTYHEQKYAEFLRSLIENPKMIAQCLLVGDRLHINLNGVIQTLLGSIYANCIMQDDERQVLQVLRDLIDNQIAVNDNPLRLLRKGSCAFSKFYKIFCEGLFSAKLFLTAALHQPIMRLLMEDDWFYDIDPEKSLIRFPPNERLVHFGHPGSKDYEANLAKYREMTIAKLTQFTGRFIESIKRNMYCFPQSLSWMVQQLYQAVTRAEKVDQAEARAICAQLVFTFFICPAICDPEQFGITSDVYISYIARHNLMQVAQILQMLAVAKYDEIDPKLRDLFSRFEKDCMSSLLYAMLNTPVSDTPPRPHIQLQGVSRTAVLVTLRDLRDLVLFLQTVVSEFPENSSERKVLSSLLDNIPQSVLHPTPAATTLGTPNTGVTPNPTPPGTPSSGGKKKVTTKDRLKSGSQNLTALTGEDASTEDLNEMDTPTVPEDVLVIPIHDANSYPGMMSESKVLDQENAAIVKQNVQVSLHVGQGPVFVNGEEVIEKRTRFSLSHDQDSIGNTSDNVELVSEACSSHSVGSQELEDQENDNLSDMLSANVSGRGSPSISGRDTPLSQNDEETGEREDPDENTQPAPTRRPAPDLPVTAQKPSRMDVTERFGKFDIRNDIENLRDEAKSTVSDTWSTDVLASDSEPPEQNQMDRLEEVAEEMLGRSGLLGVKWSERNEVSETASDAWSTDVLASDTDEKQSERLLELDQDDQMSVSSKSQCTDDQEREREEFGEDTPQPSGVQSPADTSQEFGALGGPPIEPRELIAYQQNERFNNNNSKSRRGKPSRPDHFSEAVDRRNFDPFDRNTYTFEDTNQIIQRTGSKAKRRRSHESQYKRVLIAQSPDGGDSVDYSFLPLPGNCSSSSSSNTSSHHRQERDSGISETPQDENRDETASLGLLSEKLAKVNLERTSDTSTTYVQGGATFTQAFIRSAPNDLAMFDPLCTGSDSEDDRKSSTGLNDSMNSGKVADVTAVIGNENTNNCEPTSQFELKLEDKSGDNKNKKTSIFRAFKDRWNNKAARKSSKPGSDSDDSAFSAPDKGSSDVKSLLVPDARRSLNQDGDDRGEDILSKYRRKTMESVSPDRSSDIINAQENGEEDNVPAYDPNNLEMCQAFLNAKRKLRLVFSSADFQTLPWSYSTSKRLSQAMLSVKDDGLKETDLVSLLRMQLAEAINLQDKDLIAQLHETIRCVKMFSNDGTKKLLRSLKEDYKSRAPYISYLVQCRQGLLSTQAHLERLLQRIEKDKEVCNKYLVSMCVRCFLEKKEGSIINLVPEFTKLTAADEKTDLLERFLDKLYRRMSSDPMWKGATEGQIDEGRLAVERSIMSRLYFHAMFPNGDGDTLRDKILSQHMGNLSETLTPTHPSLRIPKVYHSECPWPSAQAELFMINAYKTPKDKVTCIMNCSAIIMNLLSMANEKSVPAADDFIPVLIFVIIKANPSNLLSTVQYINSLYEKRFNGEEQYWWMQFSSAVEFIKTM